MQLKTIATIFGFAASTLALAPGEMVSGVATHFYQDCSGAIQAGSCGAIHSDDDIIVAISPAHGHNAHCGKTVTIKNIGGGVNNFGEGNSITATIVDTCPVEGCQPGHLDLSVAAFKALTGGQLDPPGMFNIEWALN